MRRYAYDRLGRLVADSAGSYPGCSGDSIMGETCTITSLDSAHAFSYDAVGNRTDHSGSYDTLDRVQSFAGYSFAHDADGNVTQRNGQDSVRFFWSAEGRLDSVNVVSGTRTSYQYDAMGRLARRSVNGSLDRLFLWQGDDLLAEVRYVSANTVALVAEYSWYPGIDQPHAVRTPGNVVRYFGMDGVGSVSVLTEDSKPLVYFNYEPWGRALVRTMSGAEIPTDTVRPRWKGAFFEPVAGGMYYMRNRWYDPATGRFLSEDPLGPAGGVNLYAFADGDPINARDPDGTDMERDEKDPAAETDCNDPANSDSATCAIKDSRGRGKEGWWEFEQDLWFPTGGGSTAGCWAYCGKWGLAPSRASGGQESVAGQLQHMVIFFGFSREMATLPPTKDVFWKDVLSLTGVLEGTWNFVAISSGAGVYQMRYGRYDGYVAHGDMYVRPMWGTAFVIGTIIYPVPVVRRRGY